MTVKELIERLQAEDQDRIVVLSRDAEGNGFDTLHTIETASYEDGEIGIEALTDDLIKQGYGEEDVREGQPALVLWP